MFDNNPLGDFSLGETVHNHLIISTVLVAIIFVLISIFGDILYSLLFLCLAIQLAQHKRIRNLEDKDK